jgi:PAS domain S-box-containing protein
MKMPEISMMRQTLQESRYARSLIEASHDPLFTISTTGKVMDMNNASLRITCMTREEMVGTDFSLYFTEPDKAREGYELVFAKGFVADFPLTLTNVGRTDVLFNGSVFRNDEGDLLGAVVVARDITEQKRIEKELNEARIFAELATARAEQTQAKAESATIIARHAVKAKQQFLSNMSHEIRTPMNAIIGFTKVALKTDLTVKQREYLNAIKLSGDALIVLINDILDLAKVDAGRMTFEQTPFKLAVSISAMLHLFEIKIQEKNLSLIKKYDESIPEVLVGDPMRLHQIMLNLLSNAVKFTSTGGIEVSVRMLAQDNELVTLEFAVTDTGIGIHADRMDSIFENFQQASSSTSRIFGGTGLGLAIVKQLVESQKGTISVVSELDKGSTFSFQLNFLKTTANAEAELEMMEIDHALKGLSVLVVEDIPLNQLLMKTLLDDFGFELDIAANGKIAIEKLMERDYDIILMDLQMPEMDGFEATEHIRKVMGSNIPIIALTADVTAFDMEKCKALGMNDFVAKPVDERLLYSKIVGLTGRPRQSRNTDTTDEAVVEADIRLIDLSYLSTRTKANASLMAEMIDAYLEQTPKLVSVMQQSLEQKDWMMLRASVHKMMPSFSIMGISPSYEEMARKVHDYAGSQEYADDMKELVRQLADVHTRACQELSEELTKLKTAS